MKAARLNEPVVRKKKVTTVPNIDRRSGGYLGAHVGRDIVAAYALEAKKRGMPLSRLIAKILRSVASGQLVDAVLDDD